MRSRFNAALKSRAAVLALLAILTSACSQPIEGASATMPVTVVIDLDALTQRKPISLQVGEHLVVTGYASDSISVANSHILQLSVEKDNATPAKSSAAALYTAVNPGQTELIIAHSMCEGVTGCSGPAFYHRLPVYVLN